MARSFRPFAQLSSIAGRLSCCLGAALAFEGCASYRPAPLEPDAELAQLRARTASGAGQDIRVAKHDVPLQVEFDVIDGVDEAELVAIAVTLNPDLQVRRAAIGEAQALLVAAGVLPNPTVAAGWRSGVTGAPGFNADLDLLFALLRPGERAHRREVASSRIDEVRAQVWSAEWDLVGQLRLARLAVWERHRALQLARLQSDLRRRLVESVSANAELGDSTRLEVMFAELELAEAEQTTVRKETELARARSELNELVGLPASAELPLTDLDAPLVVSSLADPPKTEDLERRVVAGRPELRELEASYRAAEKELELAVRRQYPSLFIGPSFGREPEHESYLGFALGIDLPIFDRNQGEIAEKEARRQTLQAAYRAMLHHSVAAAGRALTVAQAMKREFDARVQSTVPRADRLAELSTQALQGRDIGALAWIQTQRTILDTRAAYLESAVAYQRAVIEYEAAIGSFASMSAAGTGVPEGSPTDDRR